MFFCSVLAVWAISCEHVCLSVCLSLSIHLCLWLLAQLQTWRALIFSRVCLSVCLLARLQTWRALIFTLICLFVCVSLTGTSTLQREPILTELGHKDLVWSSLAATIMVQIGRRGTAWRLFENFKKKILKNHRIRISKFCSIIFCVCVSCVL